MSKYTYIYDIHVLVSATFKNHVLETFGIKGSSMRLFSSMLYVPEGSFKIKDGSGLWFLLFNAMCLVKN